jgi:inner membrane protein
MDSITHIALGGLLGEVFLGKQLGKRAMVLGAVAQSLPDIDVVASFWLDVPHDLLAHRGFTHSFLFVVLISPTLAAFARRWFKNSDVGFKKWILFFAFQLMIHLLLDSLNAYGTGWLEPFSHKRFSFHIIFVADPFYTTWLLIVFVVLLIIKSTNKFRTKWAIAGLTLSSVYLVYAFTNKIHIDRDVNHLLNKQSVSHLRYFATPTPFNTWLWFIVAEDQNGYQVGHRSVFDEKDSIEFHYFPRNEPLLATSREQEDLKLLLQFSQGYYSSEQRKDTLVFNDLRFGQRIGWDNPDSKFVFQYYLTFPGENKLVVQRGRFAGWNAETMRKMYQRIRGN